MKCKTRDAVTGQICGKPCRKFDEWEVRQIDEHGDAFDVDHHDTEAAAMAAMSLDGSCKALVLERHIGESCGDHGIEQDEYETVKTIGDEAALREGGWID